MSGLTRNETAEPVSRDQILRRERGREIFIFPVQLATSSIGSLTRLIHTLLAICFMLYVMRATSTANCPRHLYDVLSLVQGEIFFIFSSFISLVVIPFILDVRLNLSV